MSAFVLLAAFLIGAPATATQITLGGQDFEISTITGSFDVNSTLLMSQPWWGDSAAASSAADQVGNALGFPNIFSSVGPYFAYAESSGSFDWYGGDAFTLPPATASVTSGSEDTTISNTFAVAQPINTPEGGRIHGHAWAWAGRSFRDAASTQGGVGRDWNQPGEARVA